jgi:tRNA pseudouridine38-40 synthase
MNAGMEDLHAWAIAEVPPAFSPRRARSRWYRYFLSIEECDAGVMERTAGLFEGKHDFIHFCRNDERTTIRTIGEVSTELRDDRLIIDIRAREFLWNMVRRMVGAIVQVGQGRATMDDVRKALNGKEFQFGSAPPENLFLMDVEYDIRFESECPDTLFRKLMEGEERAFLDLEFNRTLIDRCLSSEPGVPRTQGYS